MPLFNFVCSNCGNESDHVVFSSDGVDVCCEVCGAIMDKQFPDSFRFKLLYDPKHDRVGWSNDGYATTQRYREYDKQAKHNVFDMGQK